MEATEFRRHLHKYPELSFEEHRTAEFIGRALDAEGIAHRRVAGTGVLAVVEGKTPSRRAVVLRADIDALPIREATALEYASVNEGVMHACGHDMHAAVLFGVLQKLHADPDFEGTVFGLFQPGEECNPGGASKVLAEKPFEGYDVVAVVGEHVDAALEVGELGFCQGKAMASNDELRLYVRGRGGHGAMRSQVDDSVTAAANIVTILNGLNDDSRVLSFGRVIADGATNIIPSEVYMEGTLRTFDEEERRAAWNVIKTIAESADHRYGTSTEVDISHGYPCVANDATLTVVAGEVAAAKGYRAVKVPKRTTSEDFGWYCTEYPSLFYRLGVGSGAGKSHTDTFAPDERAIEAGISFMHALTLKLL